jgi:hypothetical protein
MSFRTNASPLGQGRSTQAIDFARRASNKLLPWIREHYHIHSLSPADWAANGGAAGLYNYHLRGDYYLGLTKTAVAGLGNLSLGSMPPPAIEAPPRLVNVAETPRAFTGIESNQLVDSLIANGVSYGDRLPAYRNTPATYGLLSANDTLAGGPQACHFFSREVANGSMLTEFLFAEQATMTYRLLPYMDNLSKQVRDFLVDESLHFINNIDRLQTPTGSNPYGVHPAFDLTDINDPVNSIMTELDGIVLPGFTLADIGEITMYDMANINPSTSSPTFTGLIGTVGAPIPIFTLPIYYALTAYKEYQELIEPDLDAALQGQIDTAFGRLFRAAVEISYQAGGYMTETAILALGFPSVLTFNTRFFQSQARAGGTIFRCVKSNSYSEGGQHGVRALLGRFLDTYFQGLSSGFPPGTIVTLNIDLVNRTSRYFFERAENFQVENRNGRVAAPNLHMGGADPNRFNSAEMDAFFDTFGTRFMITGDTGTTGSNSSTRTFSMVSVQDDGTPSAEILEIRRIPEHYNVNGVNIPGITVYRNANQGSTDPRKNSPMNIIGRLLLSASYSIFNAGSYLNTQRDMRKLTSNDSPGHFPPLNEAIRTGAVRHGQVRHEAGNNLGVIDLYAEQRADLINDYLAAMYDSLKGRYRDEFVSFYDGDLHSNELSFYSAAVSNYISSEVAPEDANRDAVLVGPRLATRLPQDPVGPVGTADYRQIVNLRNADPELIYYQIDSPLLREVLLQLNVRFYAWYTTLAEGLDRGIRNTTRAGQEVRDEFTPGTTTRIPAGIIRDTRSGGDRAQDRERIRPTKALLESMWPLLNTRATNAVESSAVPAHTMLRTLALAVNRHRNNTSNAVPAVPISMSFVDFGSLLRSPTQMALPPSTSSKDVSAFIDYLQATYYNDYAIIAELAGNIETVKTENMTQDQLIVAFQRLYLSYRNTKAFNRFTFPATATLVHIFRELIAVPGLARARAAVAAADADTTTTAQPPAPYDQPADAPPIPEPMRRP